MKYLKPMIVFVIVVSLSCSKDSPLDVDSQESSLNFQDEVTLAKHPRRGKGKIAFFSDRDNTNGDIFIMNADGSKQTNLTNDTAIDVRPSLSRDGKKIAFASDRGPTGIFVMKSNGSGITNVFDSGGSSANDASWSPDGKRVAFRSNIDGDHEIYVVDLTRDRSNLRQLTNNSNGDFAPSWSPNGKKIVFHSDRDGNDEIYVMNSDGSNQTRLTNSTANEGHPNYSPHGRKIVFHSDVDGNLNIYVMRRDGTNQTQLTNDPANDSRPKWSPFGTHITFHSPRDGDAEIFTMKRDGSNQTPLTNNSAVDVNPSWGRGKVR